ncbi:type III polyketide synthase [Flavihumibacter fluvii]|uniref:type III polyketide synthase n=1 Tax=Flavihumibacter fluvii TaxID=2838157 RepID=UPI001BDF1F3A|nr:type III polyketide synthase [Flavihumibacter fluvii]ULQ52601.1 type III polyketide synthase [Flavihumibacter fluvii]
MTKILSIGTANPVYRHRQGDILQFMRRVYALDMVEDRKLKFLYGQSGIDSRYSVIPDYSLQPSDWKFYPASESLEPFPSLELRLSWYNKHAAALSIDAIRKCLGKVKVNAAEITHLITVSCTGMSAPGLDLEVMELLELSRSVSRSSINFMGCYAAVHGLKQADAICRSTRGAKVLVVCTELCTLHFQKAATPDNIASSLLFGDGSAAVLLTCDESSGVHIRGFYGEVIPKGKRDMSWELSSSGFLMTLSGYIPELIATDFSPLLHRALAQFGIQENEIQQWCIHPGGKRILQAVEKSLNLPGEALASGYEILKQFGNMSSPTILFVLQHMLEKGAQGNMIAAAFGPGLTMETFWLEADDK